jgi:predicted O-methyltransferase YrrM
MPVLNSLTVEPTRGVLQNLHAEARSDRLRFVALAPRILSGLVRGRKLFDVMTPESMKECFIPVSPEQGEFLYLTARAVEARTIVEFGTSFGISTIYLAAAVRDNGGGQVIGSEIEPSKHERAIANLERAGVADVVDVRLGDALETLRDVPEPVDLVLLDGWKDLYLPVLELLTPRLRTGSIVLADNIFTFRRGLRPYVDYMQSGEHGFASTTLQMSDGFEYSIYCQQ